MLSIYYELWVDSWGDESIKQIFSTSKTKRDNLDPIDEVFEKMMMLLDWQFFEGELLVAKKWSE